jgi:predicted nuclease of predicted toxin-antitoxin system
LRLLLDEMYSAALAEALGDAGVDAATVVSLGLGGRSDADVFQAAIDLARAILTENVSDFASISAQHLTAGGHHPAVLIALSSRCSRRPAGRLSLVSAILAVADEPLDDRVVYLRPVRTG